MNRVFLTLKLPWTNMSVKLITVNVVGQTLIKDSVERSLINVIQALVRS